MPKLTDMQLILLSNAAQRDDGSLLPPPESLSGKSAAITKSIAALIKRSLAEETEATGAVLTAAGRAAIGIDANEPTGDDGQVNDLDAPSPSDAKPLRQTKAAVVLAMLERKEGATLDELIAATNWLPHTTRAALTGLRKKVMLSTDPSEAISPATTARPPEHEQPRSTDRRVGEHDTNPAAGRMAAAI